jgi:hypothetical protein
VAQTPASPPPAALAQKTRELHTVQAKIAGTKQTVKTLRDLLVKNMRTAPTTTSLPESVHVHHGLSQPAITGIIVAVIAALVIGIIVLLIYIAHKSIDKCPSLNYGTFATSSRSLSKTKSKKGGATVVGALHASARQRHPHGLADPGEFSNARARLAAMNDEAMSDAAMSDAAMSDEQSRGNVSLGG